MGLFWAVSGISNADRNTHVVGSTGFTGKRRRAKSHTTSQSPAAANLGIKREKVKQPRRRFSIASCRKQTNVVSDPCKFPSDDQVVMRPSSPIANAKPAFFYGAKHASPSLSLHRSGSNPNHVSWSQIFSMALNSITVYSYKWIVGIASQMNHIQSTLDWIFFGSEPNRENSWVDYTQTWLFHISSLNTSPSKAQQKQSKNEKGDEGWHAHDYKTWEKGSATAGQDTKGVKNKQATLARVM